MFAWGPYACFALIKQYGNKDLIGPAMGVMPSIFAKTSICYNPIIYVGLNTQFRQAFDRFRGVKPTAAKILTISTTANMMDSDVKETMKSKLQILNTQHNEQRPHADVVTVTDVGPETIELKVMNKGRKSVKIQAI